MRSAQQVYFRRCTSTSFYLCMYLSVLHITSIECIAYRKQYYGDRVSKALRVCVCYTTYGVDILQTCIVSSINVARNDRVAHSHTYTHIEIRSVCVYLYCIIYCVEYTGLLTHDNRPTATCMRLCWHILVEILLQIQIQICVVSYVAVLLHTTHVQYNTYIIVNHSRW